jgi:hypothetical protein
MYPERPAAQITSFIFIGYPLNGYENPFALSEARQRAVEA